MLKYKTERVKFSELKIGDYFRYNNKTFHVVEFVDTGGYLYNAITEEIYGESFIVFLNGDKIVNKIVK